MAEDRRQASSTRPPRKTPAERSAEFDAEQKRLKDEAQQRRAEAKRAAEEGQAGKG